MESYDAPEGTGLMISGSEATIGFGADGAVTGSGGCNSYAGLYRGRATGELAIRDLTFTEMACSFPKGILIQETWFFAALVRVSAFAVEENRLTLLYGDGQYAIIFTADSIETPSTELTDLLETNWTLKFLETIAMETVSIQPVIPGSKFSIQLGPDNRVDGVAGCSLYFATYRVNDAGMLTIRELSSEQQACSSPEASKQEKLFLEKLPHVHRFEIRRGDLRLFTADGQQIFHFEMSD